MSLNLQRMGASIRVESSTAVVEGVAELSAAPVTGSDLESAAAMVLAGLAAKGTTKVSGLKHLDRGYDDIEAKLNAVGAEVKPQQSRSRGPFNQYNPLRSLAELVGRS